MDIVYDDTLDAEKIIELVSRLSFGAQENVSADALAAENRRKQEAEKKAELEPALSSSCWMNPAIISEIPMRRSPPF